MGHAVFLTQLDALDPKRVEDALAGMGLGDGYRLRRAATAAQGVLLDGLDARTAQAVVDRLATAGISAEVGEDRWLWLPPPVRCRSFAHTREGIAWTDASGQVRPIGAAAIVLISAGRVTEANVADLGRALAPAALEDEPEAEDLGGLVLEVFTADPVARYLVRSDQFHYGGLRGELASGSSTNFARLVHELVEVASGARLNRGARALMQDEPVRSYATRVAFERESSHHLFHAHGGDLARFPLPEHATAAGLPPEAEAMLATLQLPQIRRQAGPGPGRRRKLTWLAIQIALLGAAIFWFLRVVGSFAPPSIE